MKISNNLNYIFSIRIRKKNENCKKIKTRWVNRRKKFSFKIK